MEFSQQKDHYEEKLKKPNVDVERRVQKDPALNIETPLY